MLSTELIVKCGPEAASPRTPEQVRWPWRPTLKRSALLLVVLLIGSGAASEARAQGYTVYIKNLKQSGACWVRSGFAHDVFKTLSAARASVNSRVAENRRHNQDFEAFAIVQTSRRPPTGCLNSSAGSYRIVQQYTPSQVQPTRTCLYYAVVRFRNQDYYLGGYRSTNEALNMVRTLQRAYPGQITYRGTIQRCQ